MFIFINMAFEMNKCIAKKKIPIMVKLSSMVQVCWYVISGIRHAIYMGLCCLHGLVPVKHFWLSFVQVLA